MKLRILILAVVGGLLMAGQASAEEPVPEPTYWKQIDGPLEIEPTELTTSYGTSSSTMRFEDLVWEGWGEEIALGTGTVLVNSCRPFCLAGNYVRGDAKVWLSNPRTVCGPRRYMHIRVSVTNLPQGQGPYNENYDDVTCETGSMVNPGGRPYPPPPPPLPTHKPKLKRATAKSLYKRTMQDEFTFLKGKKKYVRCYRKSRLRMRCRGKWTYWGAYDGGMSLGVWKTRGNVRKDGNDFTVKINAKHWIVYPEQGYSTGPYRYSATGYFVWR